MSNNYKFGRRSREKLEGTQEIVKVLARKALKYTTVDFSVIDGRRTQTEQKAMFDAGKSELDGSMKISDHQTGLAIDVIPVIDKSVWDVKDSEVAAAWLELYRAFMRAAMKLGVELEFGVGYNIGSEGRDYPHISIKGR
jgi:peptidoglycan L-alanyl-D-glutamate endopeptidase CwlK